jgi:hypothetical protein
LFAVVCGCLLLSPFKTVQAAWTNYVNPLDWNWKKALYFSREVEEYAAMATTIAAD